MPRPVKDKQRISISGSVLPEISAELDSVAIREDRTKSQVIERILLRGLAAYRRDGLLAEPDSQESNPIPEGPSDMNTSPYLMSDPKGTNAGTKRIPAAIRKDIADAKAHVRKIKQQQS